MQARTQNQGPGVTEIAQKKNKKCIWVWDCFGKQVFKEIIQFGLKHAQKGSQIGHLSWPGAPHEPSHFHPWVNMVAQVVPNGAQSGSKGTQRLPK